MNMAPETAILIPNLQLLPNWSEQNTPSAPEPDIDPNPPGDCYTFAGAPGMSTGRVFAAKGRSDGQTGGWLSAIKLPYIPGISNGQLDFDLWLSQNALTLGNTFEFDFLACLGGFNYLFGFQVLPRQGQLQISNPQAGWQAVFSGPKSLNPAVKHHFTLSYAWDPTAHTFTFVGIVIDGVEYQIPAGQNSQQASNPNWDDCLIVQVQQGTTGTPGWWEHVIDNMVLSVW